MTVGRFTLDRIWCWALQGLISCAIVLIGYGAVEAANNGVRQQVFVDVGKNQVLKLEWLYDGLIHFEFTDQISRRSDEPIHISPMIKEQIHTGPRKFEATNTSFVTAETKVTVGQGCFAVQDAQNQRLIAKVCAVDLEKAWKRLEIDTLGVQNIYGLGQMFGAPGSMTVDRAGQVIATQGQYGNSMPAYAGGATGEAMFPVVFALGARTDAWSLVLDNIYKQSWDLSQSKWRVSMFGDQLRGYIITGDSPRTVRQRFMFLSGRPPVPPRKMFGYWMSEYGYENWDQIRGKLSAMRRDGFPIDGFNMDLQWFGNVAPGSDHTRMGALEFDESHFPSPQQNIQSLLKNDDIGLVTIEESYVGRALDEYNDYESKGFFAHECGRPRSASYLTGEVTGNASEWWGRGGMFDWSNPEGGAYWHDTKRQKLVNMGIFAHWLDLGEPEMFDPKSCYHGATEKGRERHQDIHNLFSLLWAKSLWDGFERQKVTHRPFSMIRSGNIGLQRYGAGMWSGDISGNMPSLAAHLASHAHMSWSGIDYYSSDIGGFHRNRVDGKPLSYGETQENFTVWFANATWFDVPVRSHVMNLDHDRETAPDRIGHVESNRVNLLTRYSLTPYYYSLAHRAYQSGDPLMEPMALRFPTDGRVRQMGDQRMLGDLMIAATPVNSAYQRDVYLPAGYWYDFIDGLNFKSKGEVVAGMPLYRDGLFRLPVFAQGGAIIPRYAGSMNQRGLGQENVAVISRSLLLDVYVNEREEVTQFDLVEDDGLSRDQVGLKNSSMKRRTNLAQQTKGLVTQVSIKGSEGQFFHANTDRAWTIRVWSPSWAVQAVEADGQLLPKCTAGRRTMSSPACYDPHRTTGVIIQLPAAAVSKTHNLAVKWGDNESRQQSTVHFVCDEGRDTLRGYGMFVVGNAPALGSWNQDQSQPLHASEYARGVWTGIIKNLPVGQNLEWKCLKKYPGGSNGRVDWQPGSNNTLAISQDGGFAGMSYARW